MTRYAGNGEVGQFIAPEGGISDGETVVIGALLVVAVSTAWAGATFLGAVSGAWHLAKVPAETWPHGIKVFWDDRQKLWTKVATGNRPGGVAWAPSAEASTTGIVRLDGAAR
jgi:predicted RecA/RadA family phage recombinase